MSTTALPPAALETLLENQRRFLAFLTPRVGSPDAARELLQAAMVKALERGGSLREGESAVAWFYRLLRNALIDRARHAAVEERVLSAAVPRIDLPSLERHVCACVEGLLGTVKPEYAEIVRAVDLDERELASFAEQKGVTPGNARVRLHRARTALSRRLIELCGTCCRQGCASCSCEQV